MNELSEANNSITPPKPIRVETALPRFPIHRLAKHGDIVIDIREVSENGEVTIRWEVSYNSKYGQPGPLAYKIDTLIINRRIEEAARPVPRIIRLGSLKELCRELGIAETGPNSNSVKKSLYQNSFSAITAKMRYRLANGKERTTEFGDTRYGVVFTGESLPDGRTADAVYIVLHDFYMEILNHAMTRPLDYDYLKSLPPAPQRFYELLSFQMYAAIKNDRGRAKLLYSHFCTHAPQVRYVSFNQVKKQMFKIHKEHRKSGYIAKIDFEQTVGSDGIFDWIMLYQPGPKAHREFQAFTKRGGPVKLETEPFITEALPSLPAKVTPPLVTELIGRGVTEAIACQLAAEYGEDRIRQQIEILDWQESRKQGKISDPAAWLVIAVKNGHAPPKGFIPAAERLKAAEAKKAKDEAEAEERRRKQQAEAQELAEKAALDAYLKQLGDAERADLEAKALAAADEKTVATYNNPAMKSFRETMMRLMLRDHLRPILNRQTPARP